MKLKEFLTQKINKDTLQKDSVKRAIKITICCAFILSLIFQLVCCSFGPLVIHAYSNPLAEDVQLVYVDELPTTDIDDNAIYVLPGIDDNILLAGTYRFHDDLTQISTSQRQHINFYVPITNYVITQEKADEINQFLINQGIVATLDAGIYEGRINSTLIWVRNYVSENTSNIVNNNVDALWYEGCTFTVTPNSDALNIFIGSRQEWECYSTAFGGNGWGYYDSYGIDFRNIVITENTVVTELFSTWFKANSNYNAINENLYINTSYHVHYNNTWFDTDNISTAVSFINYRVTNPSSVNTLPELLDSYTGSFDSLVDMLNSNNYNEYESYLSEVEDSAFNRGASASFGENMLGSAFNAPLDALHQWVLFETPGGIEVTMGALFTAVIALAVLVIFLKMFAGG